MRGGPWAVRIKTLGFFLISLTSGGDLGIALDVWVTQEQEGLKGERVLRNL